MNQELVNFILKARRIGYTDSDIKKMLTEHHWPAATIKEAFMDIDKQSQKIQNKEVIGNKVKTFVYLEKNIIKSLEARAKKNLFTLNEQIEDILRRSVVGQRKGGSFHDNVDDKLIGIFSRKRAKK